MRAILIDTPYLATIGDAIRWLDENGIPHVGLHVELFNDPHFLATTLRLVDPSGKAEFLSEIGESGAIPTVRADQIVTRLARCA